MGVADSGGAAVDARGLDVAAVLEAKRAKRSVATLPGAGRPGMGGLALVREVEADLLLASTPTNLTDARPGLDIVREALRRGMPCVLASKGPLVLAFQELAALSDWESPGKPALRFSGAVCGALSTVNVGRRDLALGTLGLLEGVLNSTSHLMLTRMGQGLTYEAALKEAREIGIAEPDPSLDVGGWDTANKRVILANAVPRVPTMLKDVAVTGMRGERGHAAGRAGHHPGVAEAEALARLGRASPVRARAAAHRNFGPWRGRFALSPWPLSTRVARSDTPERYRPRELLPTLPQTRTGQEENRHDDDEPQGRDAARRPVVGLTRRRRLQAGAGPGRRAGERPHERRRWRKHGAWLQHAWLGQTWGDRKRLGHEWQGFGRGQSPSPPGRWQWLQHWRQRHGRRLGHGWQLVYGRRRHGQRHRLIQDGRNPDRARAQVDGWSGVEPTNGSTGLAQLRVTRNCVTLPSPS